MLFSVIIPDRDGSYSYFTESKVCCSKGCTYYQSKSNLIFYIMQGNLFNHKLSNQRVCDDGSAIYYGEYNYMLCVKWSDFVNNMEGYVERAYKIQDDQGAYNIQKEI